MAGTTPELHGHWRLPEPRLSFDATDPQQVALNPLVGLRDHGPFTARVFHDVTLRIALLAPTDGDLKVLRRQLNELVHPQEPKERRVYLPAWPGFEAVFRAKLGPAEASAQVPLPTTLDADLAESAEPRGHLASALIDGLRKLVLVRDRFDVVVFYLPRRFASLFEDRDAGFDLHDTVKAVAAQLGLTTQIITDDALGYSCRASVACD
jgi:hypothetical protein